jgi:hypothetical protein
MGINEVWAIGPLGQKLKENKHKSKLSLSRGSVVSFYLRPSCNQAVAMAARGAAGPRNFAKEEGVTRAISDLAGAAAPARPNIHPPVMLTTNKRCHPSIHLFPKLVAYK